MRLADRIVKLKHIGDVLDDSDRRHIDFLTAYGAVLAGDFGTAQTQYEPLVALPDSAKLGNRMKGAAAFNAQLCRARQVHGGPLPTELPLSHKGVKFWEDRLSRLQEIPKASALIDPLPPSK